MFQAYWVELPSGRSINTAIAAPEIHALPRVEEFLPAHGGRLELSHSVLYAGEFRPVPVPGLGAWGDASW